MAKVNSKENTAKTNNKAAAGRMPAKGTSKAGEIAKTIVGLFFLPIVVSVSVTFYQEFDGLGMPWSVEQQYFMIGVITYCFMHLVVFKPSYIYVFGHESVHALATWLCLGQVKSFKVSSNGGSISTSKNNIFISLAPYFVPFYSIVAAIAIYIANNVFLASSIPYKYFLFFLGLTLAMHIVMTIDSLKTKQPDLVKAGYLISEIIIYVVNMIVIAGVLSLMTKGFSFPDFIANAWNLTIDIYQRIFAQLFINSH